MCDAVRESLVSEVKVEVESFGVLSVAQESSLKADASGPHIHVMPRLHSHRSIRYWSLH